MGAPLARGRPTVLLSDPNPLILDVTTASALLNRGFGFIILWTTNTAAVVEATRGLANGDWLPVSTNNLTGGSAYFEEPRWATYPARFYRIRSP